MTRWFRYYDDALNDPKVQRLSGELFKSWVNLLCLASKSGGELASLHDVAFALRLPEIKAAAVVTELATKGLLDRIDDRYFAPHKWSDRQFKSDGSTDRVKRFRNQERNVSCNVSETETKHGLKLPETEIETGPEQIQKTDTEKKEDCRESVPTRYPEDFENGFWKPYPRTPVMSKKEALTAWKRLAPEDREKAVAAVNPYLAFLRSKPDHPAVHACRFLSQRRFDGFAAAPLEAEQRKIIRPRHGQILGPEFGEKAAGKIFVLAETPEWDAWCSHIRSLGKITPPRHFHEGWAFTTLWPPGYEPQTEAAE